MTYIVFIVKAFYFLYFRSQIMNSVLFERSACKQKFVTSFSILCKDFIIFLRTTMCMFSRNMTVYSVKNPSTYKAKTWFVEKVGLRLRYVINVNSGNMMFEGGSLPLTTCVFRITASLCLLMKRNNPFLDMGISILHGYHI